jgi:hypothetical protein
MRAAGPRARDDERRLHALGGVDGLHADRLPDDATLMARVAELSKPGTAQEVVEAPQG